MKVLYMVSQLGRSGPTQQLYNLIRHLDTNRFEPVILTLSPEGNDSLMDRFVSLGISLRKLELSRIDGYIRGPRRLREEVENLKPDIIHSQGIRADQLSAKILNDFKRVATVRNYPFDDYPKKFGKWRGTFMANAHIRSFRRMDQLVACSNSISNMVSKHHLAPIVVQNGVNEDLFHPTDRTGYDKIRDTLGLPRDKKVFVSVGSLISRKDPMTVIRGFLTSERVKDSMLVFLGDGPMKAECEREAAGHANIKILGQVPNVADYLRAADFMISASHAEGMPNTVLESFSSGVPGILSDIQPHREILDYNAEAALLFRTGSAADLAQKLNASDEVDLTAMSTAAQAIIGDHLSDRQMSLQYQNLYITLAG